MILNKSSSNVVQCSFDLLHIMAFNLNLLKFEKIFTKQFYTIQYEKHLNCQFN